MSKSMSFGEYWVNLTTLIFDKFENFQMHNSRTLKHTQILTKSYEMLCSIMHQSIATTALPGPGIAGDNSRVFTFASSPQCGGTAVSLISHQNSGEFCRVNGHASPCRAGAQSGDFTLRLSPTGRGFYQGYENLKVKVPAIPGPGEGGGVVAID